MSTRDPEPREASTDRLPHKPTREGTVGATDPNDLVGQRAEPAGTGTPEHLAVGRKDVGSAAESGRHPPHVTRNDADAEVQDELPSPGEVPVLPANAAGMDKVGAEEQRQTIDEASMYDRRPERDKDRPPSERVD